VLLIAVALAGVSTGAGSCAEPSGDAALVRRVAPSVVTIMVEQQRVNGQTGQRNVRSGGLRRTLTPTRSMRSFDAFCRRNPTFPGKMTGPPAPWAPDSWFAKMASSSRIAMSSSVLER